MEFPGKACSRVLALLVTTVLAAAPAVPAWASEVHRFDIPEEDAAAAIHDFGSQAHVQILVAGEAVKDKKLHAVSGDLSTEDALNRLLAGSGLSHKYVGDSSIALLPVSLAAESADQGAPTSTPPNAPDKRSSLQLAQLDQTASGSQVTAQPTSEKKNKEGQLEEIVVTGTHIRGIKNPTSPLLTLDREAIDNSGYSTVQDLFREIPQNFGGGDYGASPDGALGGGAKAGLNLQGASGINLRGLGESSTLVLLDGHRVVASDAGSFVDISTIPLAALEGVDVLTDGASAVYGADAVAGVVNFHLRRNLDGAETEVRYGSVTSGGLSNLVIGQTLGHVWTSGDALLALQYRNQDPLSTLDRSFTSGAPAPNDIYPRRTLYFAVATVNQMLTDKLSLAIDGFVTATNSSRPFSEPTQTNFETQHQTTQNYSLDLGYKLPGDWLATLSGTYGNAAFEEFQPYSTPPTAGYVPGSIFDANTIKLASGDLKIDGPIADMPGGHLKAAVGIGYRQDYGRESFYAAPTAELDTRVKSGYAEIYAPLVGSDNHVSLVRHLELSASVRYDDYSNFGTTTNPKLGLLWSPVDDLKIRGSWGTSFRPPTFHELYSTLGVPTLLALPLTAPTGAGSVPAFVLVGSDGNLSAEKARTWSAGLDYTPQRVPGLALNATYYNVHFTDRIVTPPADFNALTQPSVYGSLITHLPDDAASAAFLASALSQGDLFLDLIGNGSTGIRYVYNDLTQNAAFVIQRGVDFSGRYAFSLGGSDYEARLNAAYIETIDTGLADGAKPVDVVNTYGNPLRLRIRADLTWKRSGWVANGALNWANSYTDTTVNPHDNIPSWTTVDLMLRYTFPSVRRESVSLQVSALNVLNVTPPYAGGGTGSVPNIHYDPGNADPRGRFLTAALQVAW